MATSIFTFVVYKCPNVMIINISSLPPYYSNYPYFVVGEFKEVMLTKIISYRVKSHTTCCYGTSFVSQLSFNSVVKRRLTTLGWAQEWCSLPQIPIIKLSEANFNYCNCKSWRWIAFQCLVDNLQVFFDTNIGRSRLVNNTWILVNLKISDARQQHDSYF